MIRSGFSSFTFLTPDCPHRPRYIHSRALPGGCRASRRYRVHRQLQEFFSSCYKNSTFRVIKPLIDSEGKTFRARQPLYVSRPSKPISRKSRAGEARQTRETETPKPHKDCACRWRHKPPQSRQVTEFRTGGCNRSRTGRPKMGSNQSKNNGSSSKGSCPTDNPVLRRHFSLNC